MSEAALIRPATAADADAIAAIYNHYVHHSIVTFETEPVTAVDMRARLARLAEAGLPWLVAVERGANDADAVVGYAYAGTFKERPAWRHCLETSVYVAHEAHGRGLGRALYRKLFARLATLTPEQSPHAPVHTLIAGVALPNVASVALHEAMGMEKVGVVREGGRKFDQWIDVGYWQLVMAREGE